MKLSKQYKAWRKLAEETPGWEVRVKKKGLQFLPPSGAIIGVHTTESDHRAESNTKARLKAAGLDV